MTEGAGAPAVDVSPSEIGELWIFPPLSDVEESAEFLLFTRMLAEDRRRLYSARLRRLAADGEAGTAHANGDGSGEETPAANGNGNGSGGRTHEITEHGSVPADRVSGLVERFRRRLGDGAEPLHLIIDGSVERWSSLLPAAPNHGKDNGSERASSA